MRVALVNPSWSFEGSIYFGCRAPHLPLELGYGKSWLERAEHEVLLLDGHLCGRSNEELADAVAAFSADMSVVTTAPSYLFWRCAPPELRVPRGFLDALGRRGGRTVAIGPHGSATPETTLRKLGCDVVVRGEPEELLPRLASGETLATIPALAFLSGDEIVVTGAPHATAFVDEPALTWPADWIARHHHHHHRFDGEPDGPGAEVEASRGCPYHCTFCAKIDFRDGYRRRDAGAAAAGDRRADRAGRHLRLLHRRDLPAQRAVARGPVRVRDRAASASRRASTCGSPTCSTCSGAPAASRSRLASRA